MVPINNFDTVAGGRILVIWNSAVIDLYPEDISPQVIHCRILNKSSQLSFYISFTYGLYSVVNRRSMWDKLLELGEPLSMPWIVLGDFNSVKSPEEKQLGVALTWYEFKDFVDCCLALGLHDAPTMGCYYTWYSNNEGNPVWCKLDRVLLNNEWLEAGLHCGAHFSPPGCLSDHSPVRAKEADLALQEAQTQLECDPENPAIRGSLGDLRRKAVLLAEAERLFYYQKAKIHFLKSGDKNTKFFHDMVKRNEARSSILTITKTDGTIVTSAAEIGHEFVAYYTSLLGIEVQTLSVDSDVFVWGPKLSSEHALELCRAVTPLEVKEAIFHISDNKAPGPDEFSACFFKRAWNVVGDPVFTAVLDFFRSGCMLRQLNHAIIALVPKTEHCPSVTDYRPIPCCNVVYKAITKIIADRLAPTLEHLIDRCQAAFVGGQNITNNIFLAQEMVRQYTRK
ncbi:UNVERIFIED_CONTAM: hypothetical protein Slati_3494800 [Sesamum latifolium]|uniref:Endonuclease/exonuclease/phosphatase domain-containing protein n=1 Tax=Sesamum latifolium TaxID=2727402 RepID=A0AAW2UI16_9LAMI